MELEKSNLQKISECYSKALEFLQRGNYKLAVKELRENLDVELYDVSLDILYNRNDNSIDKEFEELKQLIKMVDNKLTYYSRKKESTSDLEDKFQGDIF